MSQTITTSLTASTFLLCLLGIIALEQQPASASGIFELNLSALNDAYGRDLRLDCCAWQNSTGTSSSLEGNNKQQNNNIQANSVSGGRAPGAETCDPTKCHMIIRICVKNYQTQIDPSQCTFGELTAQVARPEPPMPALTHHHHHYQHHAHHAHSMSSLAARLQQQMGNRPTTGRATSGSGPSSSASAANIHHQRMLLQQLQQVPYLLTPAASSNEHHARLHHPMASGPRAMRQIAFNEPISFPFNFTWPGAFSLVIDAWFESATASLPAFQTPSAAVLHQSRLLANAPSQQQLQLQPSATTTYDLYKKQLIIQHSIRGFLSVKNEWTDGKHRTDAGTLAYSFRVSCQANYFGEQCNILCRPRDDVYGHFVCSDSGDVVCLPGWQGKYCEEPVCAIGCNAAQGNCTRPGECNCRLGWQGPSCDQCQRAAGCVHGSCERPHECNCEEGWGGLLCNEDLRYCTNHQPCKNGATCTNTFDSTGIGSYTCACEKGFTGKYCERRIGDTDDAEGDHSTLSSSSATIVEQHQQVVVSPLAGHSQNTSSANYPAASQPSPPSNQLQPTPRSTSGQSQGGASKSPTPPVQSQFRSSHGAASSSTTAQLQHHVQQARREMATDAAPSMSQYSTAPNAASLDHRVMVAYGIIIVCMVILVVLLLLRVFFERLSGAVVGCGQRLVASGSSGTIWPSQLMGSSASSSSSSSSGTAERPTRRHGGDATDGPAGKRHRSRSSSRHRRHHAHAHHLSTRSLAVPTGSDDVATLQNHQNVYKSRASIATDKMPVYSPDDTCSSSESSSVSSDEMAAAAAQHRHLQAAQHYSASAHYGPISHHYAPYTPYGAAAAAHHHHHLAPVSHHMPPHNPYASTHHMAPAHSVHTLNGTYAAGRAAVDHQQQQQQRPPPPPYTISGTLSHHASYGAVGGGANPLYSSQSTYGNYHPASMILGPAPVAVHHPAHPGSIYTSHSTYGTAATLAAHCVSSGIYGGLPGNAAAAAASASTSALANQANEQTTSKPARDERNHERATSEQPAADSSPYGNLQAAQAATATQRETSATSASQQQSQSPYYYFTSPPPAQQPQQQQQQQHQQQPPNAASDNNSRQ